MNAPTREHLLKVAKSGDHRAFADATLRMLVDKPANEPQIRRQAARIALLVLLPACGIDVERMAETMPDPVETLAALCAAPLKLAHIIELLKQSSPLSSGAGNDTKAKKGVRHGQ